MASEVAGAALVFAGVAAVAFAYLRHSVLVALVVLSPLPGLLTVLVLCHGAGGLMAAGLVWLFAAIANLTVADEAVQRIAAGETAAAAVRASLKARWRPLLAATLATAAAASVAVIEDLSLGFVALQLLAASATGMALMTAATRLSYGEDVIARSNRNRERWQRICDRLIAVARPRWGFTVSGIGLVFAVLAVFEMQPLALGPALASRMPWPALAGGMFFAVAAGPAIRDWRATVSTLTAFVLAVMIGFWGLSRRGAPLTPAAAQLLVLMAGLAATLLLTAGAEAGGFGREGDDATVASARMLARMGPGLAASGLAMVTGLLLSAWGWQGRSLALAVMAVFAGVGPLLFQPALAIVLETWFPRAATVAGRYRVH